MISYHYLILFYILYQISSIDSYSFTYDVLKPQFHQDFVNSCMKYPFVQNHYERLKNPTGRAVVFVFQQPFLRNGGFGDRIAGLINAAGMAVRYNRTLVIRAQNDFYKLFRPYIPPEYESQDSSRYVYNLSTLGDWAKYDYRNEGNDATELDLWNCVNMGTKQCEMLWDDPPQPHILLRGNRAFLCRWYNCNSEVSAKKQLSSMIGDTHDDDLMEVAGCMLRLVMWPTDLLWHMVDEAIESHKLDLQRRGLVKHHDTALLWRSLVSLHFRCGDLGYIHGETYDLACQHSYQYNMTVDGIMTSVYNIPPHQESGYMGYGTPIDISSCAAKILHNMTIDAATAWNDAHSHMLRRRLHNMHLPPTNLTLDYHIIVHIASDNPGGARQINETLQWPNTLLSPSGCHIEMDSSYECLRLTAVYWFIMSNSEVIITPGNNRIPNSGFSRYAAVYGLKGDTLRDPKECENILSRHDLSHIQHGNWQC